MTPMIGAHVVVKHGVTVPGGAFRLRAGELVQIAGYPGSDRVWDLQSAERGLFRLHEDRFRRATRAEIALVRHDRALKRGRGLVCDCGHRCTDMAEWHAHTAQTYNNPSPEAVELRGPSVHWHLVAVEPRSAGRVEKCTKVACSNAGNGVECWRITALPEPDTNLYGFPSEAVARQILAKGATVSRTYTMDVC